MSSFYDLVVQRLRDNCPSLLQVESGPNAAAVVEMFALNAAVTALVTPLSDEAISPKAATLRVTQTEVETFGVTMAMVAPSGFEQFVTARDEIKTAMRGWQAPGLAMPIEYAGGRQQQYDIKRDGGRWLHLLRFRAVSQSTYEVFN